MSQPYDQTQPSPAGLPPDGADPIASGVSGIVAFGGPRPAAARRPEPAPAVAPSAPAGDTAAELVSAVARTHAARVHAARHVGRRSRRPLAAKLAVIGLLATAAIGAAAVALQLSGRTATVPAPAVTTDDIAADPATIDAGLKTADTNLAGATRGLDDEPNAIGEK